MPENQYVDVATLITMLNDAGKPFQATLEKINDKLAAQATKEDLTKLRLEVFDKIDRIESSMKSSYVPRDVYEARHNQLIERDTQIEGLVRQNAQASTMNHQQAMSSIDNARNYSDTKMQALVKDYDEKIKDSKKERLSEEDLKIMQRNQWIAYGSIVIAALSFIVGHVHLF